MSFGAWERAGLTIPNYARPGAFGVDGCAHFFSLQSGNGTCIFCGVAQHDTSVDGTAVASKEEALFSKPDLDALEAEMPPLPVIQAEELLLKSYVSHSRASTSSIRGGGTR
jgi:hypothetical protein